MKKLTQSEALHLAIRAHSEKELKFLLTPYISTRLYVYFNGKDRSKRKKTFYANEHRVTYSQCMKGFAENIVLHKLAGFLGLIRFIEDLKGKYSTAKIYLRPPGISSFDILLREYNAKGEEVPVPDTWPDPPFQEDECQVLYYTIEHGRLIVHEKEPEVNTIDFKSELEKI
jgi:hypothetical protein